MRERQREKRGGECVRERERERERGNEREREERQRCTLYPVYVRPPRALSLSFLPEVVIQLCAGRIFILSC